MKAELLQPKCEERERYDDDSYREFLDDVYGAFTIGCGEFYASRIFEELDPIAYRCGLADIQEYYNVYICPVCGEEFDEDEEGALYCCQEEEEEEEEEED